MDSYRQEIRRRLDREYQQIREQNRTKQKQLLDKIYAHLPRVREIDQELGQLGLSLCGEILKKGASPQQIIQTMQQTSNNLLAEKRALLEKAGISLEMTEPIYSCKLCKDKGYVDGKRCTCYHQKMQAHMRRLSNVCANPNTSFDSFRLNLYSKEKNSTYGISPYENAQLILKLAREYAQEAPGAPANLYLYGSTGLGKTFTSDCIAKVFISRGKSVLYLSAPRLFSTFEDYKFGRDTSADTRRILQEVHQCRLLIIDDLGTEFRSAYVDSILFDIINSRLNSGSKTIISTNLTPSDLAAAYSERIASRILGGFEQVIFFGEDIRLKGAK